MQWHIITGCKGGIGKTSLTLMLLAYHLEKQEKEGVLVLDLNGMNTDSAAMLLHEKGEGKPISIPVVDSRNKHLIFQKTFSMDGNQSHYYVVGHPQNPFELYSRVSFPKLLETIKTNADKIVQELNQTVGGKVLPLKHVIIDTNYHFCNIFGLDRGHYTPYLEEGPLQSETIIVWFLWIYRQLDKLLNEAASQESLLVTRTAAAMELHLAGPPLRHIFTPVAMEPPRDAETGVLSAFAKMFYQAVTKNEDYIIKGLQILEKREVGKYLKFPDLITKFRMAHVAMGEHGQEDPHLLFIDMLVKMLEVKMPELNDQGDSQRPLNIMPLSTYEVGLKYYTDKKRRNAVARLREFETYKSFVRLYDYEEKT